MGGEMAYLVQLASDMVVEKFLEKVRAGEARRVKMMGEERLGVGEEEKRKEK